MLGLRLSQIRALPPVLVNGGPAPAPHIRNRQRDFGEELLPGRKCHPEAACVRCRNCKRMAWFRCSAVVHRTERQLPCLEWSRAGFLERV